MLIKGCLRLIGFVVVCVMMRFWIERITVTQVIVLRIVSMICLVPFVVAKTAWNVFNRVL